MIHRSRHIVIPSHLPSHLSLALSLSLSLSLALSLHTHTHSPSHDLAVTGVHAEGATDHIQLGILQKLHIEIVLWAVGQ